MRAAHLMNEAVAALEAHVDLGLWVVQDVDNTIAQVLLVETGDHRGCIQHVCYPTLAKTLKVTGCADGTCAKAGVLSYNLRTSKTETAGQGRGQLPR